MTRFPVPASLTDLEREPYSLLPYPVDFDDENEAVRAESFDKLVELLQDGNQALSNGGIHLFEIDSSDVDIDAGEYVDPWMSQDRIQALYTLVRKAASLAPGTRSRFFLALSQSVHLLCSVLSSSPEETSSTDDDEDENDSSSSSVVAEENHQQQQVVPTSFRDALACHLYMLFSAQSTLESEVKHADKPTNRGRSKSKNKDTCLEETVFAEARENCATAMLVAATIMGKCISRLWKRAVPDEDIVALPCRVAYQMLENSNGVNARKASSGSAALQIIAATVDSVPCLMNTIVAALVDLLHSCEHMAALVAELCCLVCEVPNNSLANELLREIGRMDTRANTASGNDANGKASGIKNVAPFISELAAVRPRIVLASISVILPHLDSEPYNLRSSILNAIGHIIVETVKTEKQGMTNSETSAITNTTSDEDENSTGVKSASIDFKKSRDALLDVLTERVYDVTSFTRVAALKTWAHLISMDCLPLNRVLSVTELAIDRLQDKASSVRRNAMQVLTLMLENNPFMGSLDPLPYQRKIEELEQYLEEHMPERVKAARHVADLAKRQELEMLEQGDSSEFKVSDDELQSAALKAALAESEAATNEPIEDEMEYDLKLKALEFATSALEFINLFQNSSDAFESMLLSTCTTDVNEALRLFVRARHFQLPCAVTGMRQALVLMWSPEKSIREEVMRAFIDVFVAKPGSSGRDLLSDEDIAHNMLVLAGQATASEKASIEEAMGQLVKEEKIPTGVFLNLWAIASKASGPPRGAAMLVLSMGANADPGIVDSLSRLRQLLDVGLGDDVQETHDWYTIQSAAIALQKIGRAQVEAKEESAKAIVLEQIIERLSTVANGEWCNDDEEKDTTCWFSASEQAINAIFSVCKKPERVCGDIVRSMASSTFKGDASVNSLRLSRLFFVFGHIALKLLVYSEAVTSAVRGASAAKGLAKQENADKAKHSNGRGSIDDIGSGSDDAIEDELGVSDEAEAQAEQQYAEIAEVEIVGRGLLGIFGPLLIKVVANEDGKYSSRVLMQSAVLALCKFMCISRSFCEKHLPLLFIVLAKADTTVRANTVVALGDLAFRFPNEIEPYTPKVYACLRDGSTRVRQHTLMVLTHLILNDMVKVKGQVCEIAICLKDEEVRIRDMARLLFHELSKRSNNPIYNLLPDIISRLSASDIGRESFREIMSFLLSFIKKERQNDMLVEKIVQRFPTCESIEQKSDLAFCIAQLKMNDKCVKILNDAAKLYKDALFDNDVFKTFSSMISKARKAASKQETRQLLDEWEVKVANFNSAGKEDAAASSKATEARAKAKASRRGRKSRKTVLQEVNT